MIYQVYNDIEYLNKRTHYGTVSIHILVYCISSKFLFIVIMRFAVIIEKNSPYKMTGKFMPNFIGFQEWMSFVTISRNNFLLGHVLIFSANKLAPTFFIRYVHWGQQLCFVRMWNDIDEKYVLQIETKQIIGRCRLLSISRELSWNPQKFGINGYGYL